MRQSNTFDYALAITAYHPSTFDVSLTLGSSNGMRFLRVVIYNYENTFHVVSAPNYIDMGLLSGTTGSVSDSSGLGLATTGIIFIGMTDWGLSDGNAVLDYDLSFSTLAYSLTTTSITRAQFGYVWYRTKSCPVYYY